MGIQLKNLSKTWAGFKLDNIDFDVEDDDYFILLGPTGSGKTLLIETIMGFHKPDEGKILINGVDVTDLPPEKRNLGYVSQKCVLFPHLTIRQNIEFGLKMRGVNKDLRHQEVEKTLAFTGLKHMENRKPATLSGGEKQKVALARVLALQPKVLLLDEPLTGLDAETARELREKLRHLHMQGITIVHVTHNQIEGFSLGDKMGIIRSGKIVQIGKTEDIISRPQSEFMARFLGYDNVFKAKRVGSHDSFSVLSVGEVKLAVSETVDYTECVIAIRPEDIALNGNQTADNRVNVLEGVLVDFIDEGHFVALTIEAGLPLQVLITRSSFLEKHLEIGQRVQLAIKPSVIRIIQNPRSEQQT